MSLKLLSENKCFGGRQLRYQHFAKSVDCDMTFSLFLPPQAEITKVPILYWLSGLTCTDENFVTKAGAQQFAAKHGIAILCPDTSPRGESIADDEEGAYDFGLGAGFYLNATQAPWKKHYQMYDYIVSELPLLMRNDFEMISDKKSISGHSMGGHGALTIALKNSDSFMSVSAFSPICAPSQSPWGIKALKGYLGDDKRLWSEYDASQLIKSSATHIPLLVDQGEDDQFLKSELMTEALITSAKQIDYPISVRMHAGYDHSYFFISSFIGEHLDFHAKYLLE